MGEQKNKTYSALFRKAMQGVKPITCDKILPIKPHISPLSKQKDEPPTHKEMFSNGYDPVDVEIGEGLFFVRPGIQRSVLTKLRRGQLSIEAELDLHGMIARVAQVEVAFFLRNCQNHNVRCARIVHGKGYGSWQKQPVLKNKLNNWLQQHNEVLAFCSARQADGGTGAVYVLLKRK